MIIGIINIAIGLFNLLFGFSMTTKNTQSTVMFKFLPVIIGLYMIFQGVYNLGFIAIVK